MRRIVIIIAAVMMAAISAMDCSAQGGGARPESLSKEMSSLLDAVRKQRAGMAGKDKYALMDASELYRKVDRKGLNWTVSAKSSDDALSDPVVQFAPEYCDALIAADFQPFELAPINYMRPVQAPALMGRRLKAGASVTFSLSARRACQLLLVSDSSLPLEVSASAGGKDIDGMEALTEDGGSTHVLLWWQPAGVPKVDVTVKNPGDRDVDFLMAAY